MFMSFNLKTSNLTLKNYRIYNQKLCCRAMSKQAIMENQDGGVGRHTAPPRTTRTDSKSKGKEVRHQIDKKKKPFIQTGRRGGDQHQGGEDWRCRGGTETGGVWDEWGR